jgi:hypothetical protein
MEVLRKPRKIVVTVSVVPSGLFRNVGKPIPEYAASHLRR